MTQVRKRHVRLGPWTLAMLAAAGCSDFDPPLSPDQREAPAPAPAATADAAVAYAATPPPPPRVVPSAQGAARYERAAVGLDYAFVPDPVDHAVTLVNLATGGHIEVRAGRRPRRLATAPGQDLALTLDHGDARAHVIRLRDGLPEVTPVDTAAQLNAVAFTPDGALALLYFDRHASPAAGGAPDHGLATLVTLGDAPTARDVEVGLPVDAAVLTSAPARAYLRDGNRLRYLELDADAPRPEPVQLGTPSATLAWAPQGQRAVAYHPGADVLDTADLRNGETHRLWIADLAPLRAQIAQGADDADAGEPGPAPTPADVRLSAAALAPDGSRLWIALPQRGLLLELELPGALDDPADAAATTAYEWPLQAPVSLLVANAAGTVLAIHGPADAPHLSLRRPSEDAPGLTVVLAEQPTSVSMAPKGSQAVLRSPAGYTVASLAAGRATFHASSAAPASPAQATTTGAFGWAGDALFLAFPAEVPGGTAALRIAPSDLTATPVQLDSPVRHLVAIEAGAAVLFDQLHPDGRLTRVSADGAASVTLTGFHVDDRVKE